MKEEADNNKVTLREIAAGIMTVAAVVVGLWLASMVAGCINENTGTSTIIGEQMALPEITDSSDNVAVRVYESIKGARVWTAKDSNVTIEYGDAYTNSYFGIVETRDSMMLRVRVENVTKPEEATPTNIEPLATPSVTNEVIDAINVVPAAMTNAATAVWADVLGSPSTTNSTSSATNAVSTAAVSSKPPYPVHFRLET